tara:strand:+ start:4474 stop:5628 length:1155 start_codon:yes stop_codon:yes gene_type:complete
MIYSDICENNYPLGFLIDKGIAVNPIDDLNDKSFIIHARQMASMQKEVIGYESKDGNSWRITSDEGKHLLGTDYAPFPLGFFNASIHGDIVGRIFYFASQNSVDIEEVSCEVKNFYYLTGSFVKGDGIGHAQPSEINLNISSNAEKEAINEIINLALKTSPVISALKNPLKNTFSLTANGRKKQLQTIRQSDVSDVNDPFNIYKSNPIPNKKHKYSDKIIYKTGKISDGKVELAPNGTTTKIIRIVTGSSITKKNSKVVEVDTVLGIPGMTHFAISMDLFGEYAPSPINIMGAAISFCYLTQTHRYIHNKKFEIEGLRMSQFMSFKQNSDDNTITMNPLDTHLFMNGTAPEEQNEILINLSEKTCYLHATLSNALEPSVNISIS